LRPVKNGPVPSRVVLACGAIAAAFAGLRLALLWRFPPFLDESLYASWALRVSENADDRFVSLANGKEPLLPWLGALLVHAGIEPLTSVRLVSVIAGALTVALVAGIGWRVAGPWAGLASAAIAAVLPFFVVYDSTGLYESLATATIAAALLLQLRLATRLAVADALLLGLALGAGTLTKETTVTALVLLPLSLAVFDWKSPRHARRLARWCGLVVIALLLDAAAIGVMKLSPFYSDLGRLRAELYPTHSLTAALSDPLKWIEANWSTDQSSLVGYVTLPVLAAGAVGVVEGIRRRPTATVVLVGWTVAPVLAATLLADAAYPRYLLPAIPPLIVLAGSGVIAAIDFTTGRVGARTPRIAVLGAVVAVLAVPALVLDTAVVAHPATADYPSSDEMAFVTGWPAGTGWDHVAARLRAASAGRPLVVVRSEHVSEYLGLALRHDPQIKLVRSGDADASAALLGVSNLDRLPPPAAPLVWHEVGLVHRPHDGTPIEIDEEGVDYHGTFAESPDDLRRLIGGNDASYDQFLAANPSAHTWADSWYQAHPSS
jgi:4-amino-4-deoxy-L-arabinose transferase-like glycosyltransferase